MKKEEYELVCPSCKIINLKLNLESYFCEKCKFVYKIKNNFPILINFDLEKINYKEEDILFVNKILKKNNLKEKIINFIYGVSEITRQNSKIFLNELKKNNLNKVLIIGGASQGSGTELLMNSDNISITSVDKIATKNVNYIADAHYLPFKDETFDGVWIQAVLEHVISPIKVVDEIYRILKKKWIRLCRNAFYATNSYGKR